MSCCSDGMPCCSGVPGGVSGTLTGTGCWVFPGRVSGLRPGVVSEPVLGEISGTVPGADWGAVPGVVPDCEPDSIGPLRPCPGVGPPDIE